MADHLDEYEPGALVPADPEFSRGCREVLALFRELAGPACTDAALVSLTARAVYWRARNGVVLADIRAACRALVAPDELAKITHQGELSAAFAGAVSAAVADRRRRTDAAKLRAEDAAGRAGAAKSEEVRAMVGNLLKSWGR